MMARPLPTTPTTPTTTPTPTTTATTTPTTRFPPEPSYPIDLGHVKAALCVDAFARRHKGGWILRFDDTNSRACAGRSGGRVAASVASYLRELPLVLPRGHRPVRVTFASDYFPDMMRAAESLIKHGLAYVDEDAPDELRLRRLKGEPSPWRGRAVDESLAAWRRMEKGEWCDNALVGRQAKGSGSPLFFGVLRLAFPNASDDPNAAMRDPVAFRVVLPPTLKRTTTTMENGGGEEEEEEEQEGGGDESGDRALHWRWDPEERRLLARLCLSGDDDGDENDGAAASDADANDEEEEEEDDAAYASRPPRAIPLPPPPPWLLPLYASSADGDRNGGDDDDKDACPPAPPPPPPPPPVLFPTYDLASAFLDARESCAFALRTREFRDRDAQHARVQQLLFAAAKAEAEESGGGKWPSWLGGEAAGDGQHHPPPHQTTVLEFSKILYPGLPLDKPSLRAITETHGGSGGKLSGGYTDPRLPTLAGLLRAGCDARALRKIMLEQTLPRGREAPKGASGGSWAKLWSINRTYVGRRAPRHMAVLLEEEEDDDEGGAGCGGGSGGGGGGSGVIVVELVSSPSANEQQQGPKDDADTAPLTFRAAPLPKGGHTLTVLERPKEVRICGADAKALLSSAAAAAAAAAAGKPPPTFTLLGLGAARLLSQTPIDGRLRAQLLTDDADDDKTQEAAAKAAPLKFAWVPGPAHDTAGGSVAVRVLFFSSPYPQHLAAAKPVLARAAPSPSLAVAAAAKAGVGGGGGGSLASSSPPPIAPPSPSSPSSSSPPFFDSPAAIARAFDADGRSKRVVNGWADAALAQLAARADAEGRCWGSDARLALARAGGWGGGGGTTTPTLTPPPLPLHPPPASAVVQFLRMGNFIVDRVDYDGGQGKVALVTLIAIPDGRESVWHAPATTKAG